MTGRCDNCEVLADLEECTDHTGGRMLCSTCAGLADDDRIGYADGSVVFRVDVCRKTATSCMGSMPGNSYPASEPYASPFSVGR